MVQSDDYSPSQSGMGSKNEDSPVEVSSESEEAVIPASEPQTRKRERIDEPAGENKKSAAEKTTVKQSDAKEKNADKKEGKDKGKEKRRMDEEPLSTYVYQ